MNKIVLWLCVVMVAFVSAKTCYTSQGEAFYAVESANCNEEDPTKYVWWYDAELIGCEYIIQIPNGKSKKITFVLDTYSGDFGCTDNYNELPQFRIDEFQNKMMAMCRDSYTGNRNTHTYLIYLDKCVSMSSGIIHKFIYGEKKPCGKSKILSNGKSIMPNTCIRGSAVEGK